ncbi:MAG: DNA ligase D [Planctomycetota bacterium]|nr:DNA ligase D [Planctomycetota bacterium]
MAKRTPARLGEYRRKRRFETTPEPPGKAGARGAGAQARGRAKGPAYVIQKHDATRLHYDLRLEVGGVLKSWAVPKGPSTVPDDKRLAVEVEDHPLEYGSFEGTIPQGEYGGGTVLLWDRGTWSPANDEDPARALRKGKLEFELRGERLRGRWILIRMGAQGEAKPQWILRKVQDEFARAPGDDDVLETMATSVSTGRSLEEIAAASGTPVKSKSATPVERPARSRRTAAEAPPEADAAPGAGETLDVGSLAGAKKAPMPRRIRPQLATLVERAPTGPQWLHEVKFDGYRMLARVTREGVTLISRTGKDWTPKFGAIAQGVRALGLPDCVLDGEIVASDEQGRPSFQLLQAALDGRSGTPLRYWAFDLPFAAGHDLRACALEGRRGALRTLLERAGDGSRVLFSAEIPGDGARVLREACRLGLEGIVSKRRDARYVEGRTRSWVKSKCSSRQEVVIGGFTDSTNARFALGALLVGYYDAGKLVYAGKVGTGFDQATLRDLSVRLRPTKQDRPPFADAPARTAGVHWVRPTLVCEVAFAEWTRDGRLRHPSFQGLREDKPVGDVVRELPSALRAADAEEDVAAGDVGTIGAGPQAKEDKAGDTRKANKAGDARKANKTGGADVTNNAAKRRVPAKRSSERRTRRTSNSGDASVLGVAITHPDREVYPDVGVRKLDLARYYEAIAPWLLAESRGRPLSVVRCPDGLKAACFYQKNWKDAGEVGSHVTRLKLSTSTISCIVLDDASGAVWLAQRGALELHSWGCREPDVEHPDRMVFDLDPGPDVAWKRLRDAAKDLRGRLEARGLPSVVKTTGGKGLHVVVPLAPAATWDEVKEFSRGVAEEMAREEPEAYVATMSKAKRVGRILVDYLRNARGATYVAPYSTRARPGAPVSMPLAWDDLLSRRVMPMWTVREAPAFREKTPDPWAEMRGAALPRAAPASGGAGAVRASRRTRARG